MFKRFFVSLLGTIAGIWISVISVVIIGSVCVAVSYTHLTLPTIGFV